METPTSGLVSTKAADQIIDTLAADCPPADDSRHCVVLQESVGCEASRSRMSSAVLVRVRLMQRVTVQAGIGGGVVHCAVGSIVADSNV
jgi:hypothetical protein